MRVVWTDVKEKTPDDAGWYLTKNIDDCMDVAKYPYPVVFGDRVTGWFKFDPKTAKHIPLTKRVSDEIWSLLDSGDARSPLDNILTQCPELGERKYLGCIRSGDWCIARFDDPIHHKWRNNDSLWTKTKDEPPKKYHCVVVERDDGVIRGCYRGRWGKWFTIKDNFLFSSKKYGNEIIRWMPIPSDVDIHPL